jgi:hypothetical protein
MGLITSVSRRTRDPEESLHSRSIGDESLFGSTSTVRAPPGTNCQYIGAINLPKPCIFDRSPRWPKSSACSPFFRGTIRVYFAEWERTGRSSVVCGGRRQISRARSEGSAKSRTRERSWYAQNDSEARDESRQRIVILSCRNDVAIPAMLVVTLHAFIVRVR